MFISIKAVLILVTLCFQNAWRFKSDFSIFFIQTSCPKSTKRSNENLHSSHSVLANGQSFSKRRNVCIWLWVKKGHPKNPFGRRKHEPKPVVLRGLLFDPQPYVCFFHLSFPPFHISSPNFVSSSWAQPHDEIRRHRVVRHLEADRGEVSFEPRHWTKVGSAAIDEKMQSIKESEDLSFSTSEFLNF